MRIAIVGSGPVGMTAAVLFARRGHAVTLIDRDPGPVDGLPWERVGVMQFHLPHMLRGLGRHLLATRLPDLHQALLDGGGELSVVPGAPPQTANLKMRRQTLEPLMWRFTSAEPGIERVTGHADELLLDGNRVTGVRVGDRIVTAEVVIDASGRAGKFAAEHHPEVEGGDSGLAYACRLYQLKPGAEPGPLNGGPGWVAEHDGFLNLIFAHDQGTFSVLLVRLATDKDLAPLRTEVAYKAALAMVPAAADWTDPERAVPIDNVRAGADLLNRYRPQARGIVGLLAIGDAACTTNPTAARGLSLGMMAAAQAVDILTEAPAEEWAPLLEIWALAQLRPWFVDHLGYDAAQRARWRGEPLDLDAEIPWDVLMHACRERPELGPMFGPFAAMLAPPSSLAALRAEVRAMLLNGWRPPAPHQPGRAELIDAIRADTSNEIDASRSRRATVRRSRLDSAAR
jgi:2-polyprenyl-6-methoxyphenol hydroxylase-like FAD-dependent oxidoreductase